jgi:uncharacterized integral membrane protein
VNQQSSSPPGQTGKTGGSGSSIARFSGFVARHPAGVGQSVLFLLVAIIILQNVESTSIDILFWSIPAIPKLVLIFVSMVVGAASWELMRRWLWPRS